jgi:lipopolysaccharide transport system ATP-binding protein
MSSSANTHENHINNAEIAISVTDLGKRYEIYSHPRDRLKQFILPRLQRALGKDGSQYFREFWAVNNVSFEIKKGETVGIIGRNGSGKSTLLQMICGTLTPTKGNIQTRGRIAALLELGSGFNPEFTGRENVYMNAAVLGLTKAEIDDRFDDIVAFADIGDFIEQAVKTYSSGMMVRLAFAVIAHVDADILVIDEALAVGDAFFTQKCMRFLRGFMKNGTVLFVSHDTASIKNFCNYAIWLDSGKIYQKGSPKEVCNRYLEAYYEVQQGSTSNIQLRPRQTQSEEVDLKDQRQELINTSNLRNDLKVFAFSSDSAAFGKGGAVIESVQMLNEQGEPLSWIVGGEKVIFRVRVSINQVLDSPIIGFSVKDRLGQVLFGDNTYLSYLSHALICKKGDELEAKFTFHMPLLPVGEYSVAVAIANGTQDVHVQHHWIHDALQFKSESSSVATGLVGIPMLDVKLDVKKVVI